MPRLAVVLITKDQEWNIARLLTSVLQETAAIASAEVVVVDSASTDATAQVAARFPITVLRLHADQPLSAAAGRYVGYHRTTADFVLFLDGDMELCAGWLAQALSVLEASPDVAVVSGEIIDLPIAGGEDAKPALVEGVAVARTIPYTPGAAIHRRAVLDEVGTFNPYLRSDEEPELCIRVRHAGHRIVELDRPVAYHYSAPPNALSTVVGRWRRGLYLGAGQAIRHNLHSGTGWRYVRERGYGIVPGIGLVAGLASALRSVATRRWSPFGLWTLLVGGVIAADVVRRRSIGQTLHSLLERLLILDGTIRGFVTNPPDPAGYPGRHDIVRDG
jgi:glycosyltransferase involved in cell wall biosynthesis